MQTSQLKKESPPFSGKARDMFDFYQTLKQHGLTIKKDKVTTLQINTGLFCNQTCRHCHLDAGPERTEMMTAKTIDQVVELAGSVSFQTIDITGGAPELHPLLGSIIRRLRPFCTSLIVRSNLTALSQKGAPLMTLFKDKQVVIAASFPSLNEIQVESVRGKGSFHQSINTLKTLNSIGYGKEGSGLELNLVVNPPGAFLPPSQVGVEKRFHKILYDKWGIVFNRLFSFANVPLGRFQSWLVQSGNYENYIKKLTDTFNPCTIAGLMCRNILSVSWDGYLFDCDFNQAQGLFMGEKKMHVSEIKDLPNPGSIVAVGNHCYTCTAGSGFT